MIERDSREIGSYFSIDHNDVVRSKDCVMPNLFGDGAVYYSTCRSAIKDILDAVNKLRKVALLPAFTCHAVVEPFEISGFEVFPYPVEKNLIVNPESFIATVNAIQPDVVLIHDYFGFDSNRLLRESGVIEKCRAAGITVIVDQTQSMFSTYQQLPADYYVGSIRKWMGIPDGAFAIGDQLTQPMKEDSILSTAKQNAMEYKHNYLFQSVGEKENLLPLYRQAENILDAQSEVFSISDLSSHLLGHYDIKTYANKRRGNYCRLAEGLRGIKNIVVPFSSAEAGDTPFYMPVFVKENRKELQRYLAENNVFATVIWGCPEQFVDKVDETARSIYAEILCIPCDQRYTTVDMDYICELIKDFKA